MKRLFIFFLVTLPLWFIVIGYPIRNQVREKTAFTRSQRCFVVGNLNQFLSCLTTEERISGIRLFFQIGDYLTAIHPLFPLIICGLTISQLVLLWKVIELLL